MSPKRFEDWSSTITSSLSGCRQRLNGYGSATGFLITVMLFDKLGIGYAGCY